MNGRITFVIDDSNCQCGLTDRLKAAVGLCYIALKNNLDYKFIHIAGFDMRDYLAPNKIQWSAEPTDGIEYAPNAQMIRYVAPYDDLPIFGNDINYICREYIGNNVLEWWNVPDWQRKWRELFWDMFAPTDIVVNEMNASRIEGEYTAVVVRFINSLGYTENADYNAPFPYGIQNEIIEAVLQRIEEIKMKASSPLVVYSDSRRFLTKAKERGYVITDIEGVGNIMNGDPGTYVILRNFVHLFQIAQAKEVYSILHLDGFPDNCLYKTQYPRYAAIIGDKPFIRV